MASKAIEAFKEGSEVDRIIGSLIYGEDKIALSSAEIRTLKDAELALDLIEQSIGNELMAVRQLMQRPGDEYTRSRAYEACRNAKIIFGYVERFDYYFELVVKKNRIEASLKLAKEAFMLREAAALEKEHMEVIKEMRIEQERRKPDDDKNVTWIIHCDYTKLGYTEETMRSAEDEVTHIIEKIRRKSKGLEEISESVEFSETKNI